MKHALLARRVGLLQMIAFDMYLLAACASVVPTPAVQDVERDAAKLQNWQVQGRLAAINGTESWPASVHWEQDRENYAVDLIGPLGQGRISVRGDSTGVELSTEQERLEASDPDALLAQATGLQVPISGLKYWIRGVPDPATPVRIVRNADGRIAQLEQNGWRIDYPNWIQEQGIDLPKRIQAEQGELKVKIAITTWTLPH